MVQFSRSVFRSSLSLPLLCGCLTLSPAWLIGQTSQPAAPEADIPVLKVNAQAVIVDVVVSDKNGKALQGLKQEDFQLMEDGHPQKISSFEVHDGTPGPVVNLPPMSPNLFTNVPPVKLTDAVTVLLLDGLNTQLTDQTSVRREMFKYLKNPVPGRRIAIFTLGSTLQLVQGFSNDPAVLAATLLDLKHGSGPHQSDLLLTKADDALQATAADEISAPGGETGAGTDPTTAAASAALQQFFQEQNTSQTDLRVSLTLDAFQQLGLYLAGIPGRKNVVWFSSSFPVTLMPEPGASDEFGSVRDYGDKIKKTDALLAAARVAVYPVAAEGLATDSLYDADRHLTAVTTAESQQSAQIGVMSSDSTQRNNNHTAMGLIADDTGGHAYFNTNGLSDAVTQIMDNGSSFYTFSYIPSNDASDGKFRKISVKLAKGGYQLSYRRGYFASDAKKETAELTKPSTDPLAHYMGRGVPDATEISLAMRVHPPAAQPETQATRAGDNAKLTGPTTRYAVDFLLTTSGVRFATSPDGGRHGKLEADLVAYDKSGRPLNWAAREVPLDMDAARFAAVEKVGIHFRVEIDVPKDGFSLRGGIYDLSARTAGTLEVPLDRIVNVAQAAAPASK